MRVFIVSKEDQGKRVDRFLHNELPGLPFPLFAKTFRKRDVKVNGTRIKENHILEAGDRVELFLSEELLNAPKSELEIPIVFEDENVLIINKPQGLPVQANTGPSAENTIQAVYANSLPEGFPALCHRLDTNTGGLLLLAKNQEALDILFEKFKEHEICKLYRCVVCGCPDKPYARLKAFLLKDSKNSQVKVFLRQVPGSLPIQTNYRVLESNGELCLLEVELVTGRTHQIRAHMAFSGFPVLGDGKYGLNTMNRQYGVKKQLLWSTGIQFCFKQDASVLNYLKGKTVSLPEKSLAEILADKSYL
ncbi:MAG: RluA family pseudouridine synthase [Thermoclostridium sp.]|nr:RluA family pseudouridine synthase [Thermoclostridium sp.]